MLIIEDEMLIAVTLEAMLEDLGHEVVGTAGRLDEALKYVESTDFDIAILDLKLGTEMSFPVADLLIEKQKAFIFSTGMGRPSVVTAMGSPFSKSPMRKPDWAS
jgi:DNA-binding response OmpR family regulator